MLCAEECIDDDFMLMFGVTLARLASKTLSAASVKTAAILSSSLRGPSGKSGSVRDQYDNDYRETVEVMEKPEAPPSNLVMTGFYTFSPATFLACKLVQPSNCSGYEISKGIDLLIQSRRTIDIILIIIWDINMATSVTVTGSSDVFKRGEKK